MNIKLNTILISTILLTFGIVELSASQIDTIDENPTIPNDVIHVTQIDRFHTSSRQQLQPFCKIHKDGFLVRIATNYNYFATLGAYNAYKLLKQEYKGQDDIHNSYLKNKAAESNLLTEILNKLSLFKNSKLNSDWIDAVEDCQTEILTILEELENDFINNIFQNYPDVQRYIDTYNLKQFNKILQTVTKQNQGLANFE